MVVGCPKCKTKLKVDETKLPPEGSRFKCPKCATVLLVKKPSAQPSAQTQKALDRKKVLVAHSNPDVISKVTGILKQNGLTAVTSSDGIDVMVKALKELPFLVIIEVALPKIYGFEVCKRLKERPESKEMQFMLIPAIHDKTKYRREPSSLYGADEYIEEFEIADGLMDRINRLLGGPEAPKTEAGPSAEVRPPSAPPSPKVPEPTAQPPRFEPPAEPAPQPATVAPAPPAAAAAGPADERIEKAKRLVRTVLNDIFLYNPAKATEALKNNTFQAVFAAELKEGKKLYDARIPQEVRNMADFFQQSIDEFIDTKKKAIQ